MRTVALRRIAKVINGGTPKPDAANWGGDVQWATPVDLGACHGSRLSETQRTITEEGLVEGSALVPRHSVLLSSRAPVGYVAINNVPMAFNQGCKGIIPTSRLDPRFAAYVLIAMRGELESVSNGTTFLELSAGSLLSIRVPFADSDTQRAIADFLDRETSQIDAMIEAQRGLLERIEERRAAQWANAYLAQTGQYASSALRHWVSSLVDGPFGSSLTSAHYVDDEEVRVIRLGNLGTNQFKGGDKAFISHEHGTSLVSHAVQAGDVVMAGLGDDNQPLGRACEVPKDLGPAIVKADCYRLRPLPGVLPAYLAWALSSPPVLAETRERARGITRLRLNTSIAKSVRIVVPPLQGQRQIVAHDADQSQRLSRIQIEAESVITLLRERREALITAAVTGRIDPTTCTERVEEAS